MAPRLKYAAPPPAKRSPADISLAELAESAERASRKAGKQARKAGIAVAGIERTLEQPAKAPAASKSAKSVA